MKLEETLSKYMQKVKKEHQEIEAFATEALECLGFPGPRAVTQVYKNGEQSLSVTYFADSELNRSTGEETGLRVLFEAEQRGRVKEKLSAFFRFKPQLGLTSVRLVHSEGIDNPDHKDMLEGQVREKYEGGSIKHDTAQLRNQEGRKLLAKFVQNASALMCRVHFRP